MITTGVIALAVVMVLIALLVHKTSRQEHSTLYFFISMVPLLLTVVVPTVFTLTVGGTTGWARETVAITSRVGIVLSFVLIVTGAVLTLRAVLAGNGRGALVLGLETVLAALPAGILAIYAAVFRFG